jgi:hypothetical protein
MRAQRCHRLLLSLTVALAAVTSAARAQQPPAAQPARTYPANPADVESIDAIITALYAVISGDAGVKRDWDRFHSLFVPGARLIPTGRRPDGTGGHRVLTPQQYIDGNGTALESGGFHEIEIGRKLDRYGNVVQAFSSYAAKRTQADAQPFMRGVNSIQLWNDGKRWWVVSIFWESETPSNPIPAELLNRP